MTHELRYFSMFTGIGGFELGFDRANRAIAQSSNKRLPKRRKRSTCKQRALLYTGSNSTPGHFKCVGFSEIDKYASQVLRYKFPDIRNWGDCTKINPADLPNFDLLCGGFPCQAFSLAGKRRGFKDIRGTLFFEIARILEVKRPATVLLENVKGLLNHQKGQTFRVILQTLDELGYEVQWMVLNSKFFGVPQNRERVFIVGNLRGSARPQILPLGSFYKKVACKRCVDRSDSKNASIVQLNNPRHSKNRIYSDEGICPSLNTSQGGSRQPKVRAVMTPGIINKGYNGRRFKNPAEPMFTLTCQNPHGVMADWKIRKLTPTEYERLQGFPDGWTAIGIDETHQQTLLSDTQRYKQLGNAVTVDVVAAIAKQILKGRRHEEIDT